MRTLGLAASTVAVAGLLYLTALAVAMLAFLAVAFAAFFGWGHRTSEPQAVTLAALVLAPAVLTGAVLSRTRPAYRPCLSAGVGAFAALAVAGALTGAPGWEAFAFPVVGALAAVAGCVGASRVGRAPCPTC